MAIGEILTTPSFVSEATSQGASSSATVTAPSSIVAGNQLLMGVFLDCSGVASPTAPATPSGWTLVKGLNYTLTSGHCYNYIFAKTATGSEPSSYTVTLYSSAEPWGAVCCQYANVGGIESTFGTGDVTTTGATSTTSSSVTYTATDLVVAFVGWAYDTTSGAGVTTTYPLTNERANMGCTASDGGFALFDETSPGTAITPVAHFSAAINYPSIVVIGLQALQTTIPVTSPVLSAAKCRAANW